MKVNPFPNFSYFLNDPAQEYPFQMDDLADSIIACGPLTLTMFLGDYSAPPEALVSLNKITDGEYKLNVQQTSSAALIGSYAIYYAVWYDNEPKSGNYYKTMTTPFQIYVGNNVCESGGADNGFELLPNPFPDITYNLGDAAWEYEWTYEDLANWTLECGTKSIGLYNSNLTLPPTGLLVLS